MVIWTTCRVGALLEDYLEQEAGGVKEEGGRVKQVIIDCIRVIIFVGFRRWGFRIVEVDLTPRL